MYFLSWHKKYQKSQERMIFSTFAHWPWLNFCAGDSSAAEPWSQIRTTKLKLTPWSCKLAACYFSRLEISFCYALENKIFASCLSNSLNFCDRRISKQALSEGELNFSSNRNCKPCPETKLILQKMLLSQTK